MAKRRFEQKFQPDSKLPAATGPYTLCLNEPAILNVKCTRWRLGISGRVSSPHGTITRDIKESNYELNFPHLLVPMIRACLYVLLTSRSFTEYALPFLVALVPVAQCLLLPAQT